MNDEKRRPYLSGRRLRPWTCRECGLVIHAVDQPAPKRWSDDHTCVYKKLELEKERDPDPSIFAAGVEVDGGRVRAPFSKVNE